jgi:hypothetical protein
MRRSNPLVTVIFSSVAALGLGVGLYAALHSPLFRVRVVEVVDQPEAAPVDAKTVSTLANVPLGQLSLFDLDLEAIRRRLIEHAWIRGAVLTKRFPQTLSIQVLYRSPVALLQESNGSLRYVDEDGTLFGALDIKARADLPLLSGLSGEQRTAEFRQALALLKEWSGREWRNPNQVSQLSFDSEDGYQVWTTFAPDHRVRIVLGLVLGVSSSQEVDADGFDESFKQNLTRIDSVLGYISQKSIPARQIYADSHKKIVVRTVRGS